MNPGTASKGGAEELEPAAGRAHRAEQCEGHRGARVFGGLAAIVGVAAAVVAGKLDTVLAAARDRETRGVRVGRSKAPGSKVPRRDERRGRVATRSAGHNHVQVTRTEVRLRRKGSENRD